MKRALAFWSLCLALILSACAPLQPHDSALGDAGEVAGRTVLCAVSLCLSEVGMWGNYERAQRARVTVHDARHDDAALLGLGMALSGGGPFQARPRIAPVAPPCQNIIANQIGSATYLNCY